MAVSFRDMSADAFERPAPVPRLRADRSKAVGGPRPVRHPLVRNRGAAMGAVAVDVRGLCGTVQWSTSRRPPVLVAGRVRLDAAVDVVGLQAGNAV